MLLTVIRRQLTGLVSGRGSSNMQLLVAQDTSRHLSKQTKPGVFIVHDTSQSSWLALQNTRSARFVVSCTYMTTSKDSTGRQPFWLLPLRETVATMAGHWSWHSPASQQLQQAWHPHMPCCYQGSPCQHQGRPCHTPGGDHTLLVSLYQQ